jgi:hypothetical protein
MNNQQHLPQVILVVDARQPSKMKKMKKISALPTLILREEVGRGPDRRPSLLSPNLLPGHAQVITCDLDVQCALAESREPSSKGTLFINLIILFSTQRVSRPDAIVCVDACFTQKHNQQVRDPPPLAPSFSVHSRS